MAPLVYPRLFFRSLFWAYPAACATRLKNSRAVTDRFQVAKKFNEVVDAPRKTHEGHIW